MQRAFVDPGAPLECVGAKELAPKINELITVCRKLKIPIVFLKANRHADLSGCYCRCHSVAYRDASLPPKTIDAD